MSEDTTAIQQIQAICREHYLDYVVIGVRVVEGKERFSWTYSKGYALPGLFQVIEDELNRHEFEDLDGTDGWKQ